MNSQLILDGPVRVRVDHLGPVQGPGVRTTDGHLPDVTWRAEPARVAVIEEGVVHAVGPGEAVVAGVHGGQEVRWTLVVEPAVVLRFVEAPHHVRVGEAVGLDVEALVGDRPARSEDWSGELAWSSSHPEFAVVDAHGEVTGVAPGISYVTVNTGQSSAMLELEVVGPD